MTDKRAYYTDPLVAAIMARDFGVKLQCEYTEEEKRDYDIEEDYFPFGECDMGEPNTLEELLANLEDFREIYIHPDSYSIFEPQKGDLIIPHRGRTAFTVEEITEGHLFGVIGVASFHAAPEDDIEIIQRSGKAFFMPDPWGREFVYYATRGKSRAIGDTPKEAVNKLLDELTTTKGENNE